MIDATRSIDAQTTVSPSSMPPRIETGELHAEATQAVRERFDQLGALDSFSQPLTTGVLAPKSETGDLDARVKKAAHLDEFNAPQPLVCTILAAETAGVVRNGLSIPATTVSASSPAATALGWALTPLYLITGAIMAVVGGMLLPSCCEDFSNAMKSNSAEEKWRSFLNLLDKCVLISIGLVLCLIGTLLLAALIPTATAAFVAFAAVALPIASLVFAVLLLARGVEMMVRGGYGLVKANQFQKEFLDRCKNQSAVVQWLYEEQLRDPAALKNRIGQKAVDALNHSLAKVDLSQPIDPQLAQSEDYEQLLQSLDVGISEERLKQQLFLSIGAVMFVGGALSLIAIGLTHGAAAPAIVGTALGVAGSGFSLAVEALWMPYDNPKWFQMLADWRYSKQGEFRKE